MFIHSSLFYANFFSRFCCSCMFQMRYQTEPKKTTHHPRIVKRNRRKSKTAANERITKEEEPPPRTNGEYGKKSLPLILGLFFFFLSLSLNISASRCESVHVCSNMVLLYMHMGTHCTQIHQQFYLGMINSKIKKNLIRNI